MRRIRLRCPAKVNLFLEVLGRRPDGYHDLSTVMTPIDLFDTLEVAPARRFDLEVRGASLLGANTVERAYRAVRRRRPIPPVRAVLTKGIPAGAGLGGGSSDGAGMIEALDRLFDLGLDRDEVAAEVGSDVAFFLAHAPALCTGRGEIVHPLPRRRLLHLALVVPPLHAGTPEVYARTGPYLRPRKRSATNFLHELAGGSIPSIRSALFNRLEGPALERYPALRLWFRRLGPGTRLTGSGAALFRLCESAEEARDLARRLGDPSPLASAHRTY